VVDDAATPRIGTQTHAAGAHLRTVRPVVGRCRLTPDQTRRRVDRAWFQRLKPKCDEPLSNFACKFNLRRFTMEEVAHGSPVVVDPDGVVVPDGVGPGRYCPPRHQTLLSTLVSGIRWN